MTENGKWMGGIIVVADVDGLSEETVKKLEALGILVILKQPGRSVEIQYS